MRFALLFSCLAAFVPPAFAQERVLGLLALPQVFGRGPCECSGLEVVVRLHDRAADVAMPTREYGYEQPVGRAQRRYAG